MPTLIIFTILPNETILFKKTIILLHERRFDASKSDYNLLHLITDKYQKLKTSQIDRWMNGWRDRRKQSRKVPLNPDSGDEAIYPNFQGFVREIADLVGFTRD